MREAAGWRVLQVLPVTRSSQHTHSQPFMPRHTGHPQTTPHPLDTPPSAHPHHRAGYDLSLPVCKWECGRGDGEECLLLRLVSHARARHQVSTAEWGAGEGGVVSPGACTWQRRVVQEGSRGRQNFFMELTAAGKEGAEKMAATRLILRIQDSISSLLLGTRGEGRAHRLLTVGLPIPHPAQPGTERPQRPPCRRAKG